MTSSWRGIKTYPHWETSRFDLCNQQLPTYDHRKYSLWHDYIKITSWRHIVYDQMNMSCALKYGHVMLNKFPSLAPGGAKMATKEENHWHRKCPNVAPPCAIGDKHFMKMTFPFQYIHKEKTTHSQVKGSSHNSDAIITSCIIWSKLLL